MKKFQSRFLLPSAALFLGGCQFAPIPMKREPIEPFAPMAVTGLTAVTPGQRLEPALLKPDTDIFKLGPGDRMEIEIMGDATTRDTVTVGPDGKIYYYMLPGVDVWGLTIAETRERLASGLQRYIREKPAISISLRSVASRHVWVLGRINTPGVYTLGAPTTLLDAIAQGGGLAPAGSTAVLSTLPGAVPAQAAGVDSADLTRSFVIRNGNVLPVDFQKLLREGDLSQNIYLQPDDFVFLPATRAAEVYVLGAVVRPQSQRMPGSLTLAQAVALSGGAASDAYVSNVAILRGSLTDPQIAIVDLGAIVHGKANDMRLEPGDIVYVPFTPYRTIERYANLILDTFARTIGVNAGAKAAGGTVSPVGLNITIGSAGTFSPR